MATTIASSANKTTRARHVLAVWCSPGATAFKWASSSPRDGEVVYSCADHDLQLTWDYTLDAGESVALIEWNYAGMSQELISMAAHGTFLTTPTFSHRVQRVSKAGLLLRHLAVGDSGNYSVTVTGTNSSGATFTTTTTVVVQIADSLQTTDHELHGKLEPVAIYSNATDQFHAIVACGQFTFAGNPPVTVVWTTPGNKTVPSTGYRDGNFQLFLPNPVEEGSYTCRLSPSSCSGGSSPPQTSVHVSGVLARLTVMEAELRRMKAESSRKDEELTRKDTELQSLRDNMTRKDTELQSLQDNMTRKDTELQSLRDDLEQLSTFCQELFDGPCHPDLHTVINDTWRLTSVRVVDSYYKCDNNLHPGWYRFVVNGSNAVIPTSCVQIRRCRTFQTGWLDLQGQSLPPLNQELSARVCYHSRLCCGSQTQTVVRNCGSFYVYHLQPPPECNRAHCVELQH